jgi:hypothetical protein
VVDDAVFYFEKYPELAILGGRDCLDFAIDKQKGRFDILDYDLPTKDIDFALSLMLIELRCGLIVLFS